MDIDYNSVPEAVKEAVLTDDVPALLSLWEEYSSCRDPQVKVPGSPAFQAASVVWLALQLTAEDRAKDIT